MDRRYTWNIKSSDVKRNLISKQNNKRAIRTKYVFFLYNLLRRQDRENQEVKTHYKSWSLPWFSKQPPNHFGYYTNLGIAAVLGVLGFMSDT